MGRSDVGVTLVRRSRAGAADLFAVVADVAHHDRFVPLTTTTTDDGPAAEGWGFVATTRLGPMAFDDPMVLTEWAPPTSPQGTGSFALVKRGRVLAGSARAVVRPRAEGGSELVWTELIRPAGRVGALVDRAPRPVGRVVAAVSDLATRALFARTLDAMVAAAERAPAEDQA